MSQLGAIEFVTYRHPIWASYLGISIYASHLGTVWLESAYR